METTIRLKPEEFTTELFNTLKSMFKSEDAIELRVKAIDGSFLYHKETPEEYKKRINRAIEDFEKGKNIVKFSEKEFNEYTERLLKL